MHVQLAYMVLAFHFLTFVFHAVINLLFTAFINKSNVAVFKNKEKEEGAHEVFFPLCLPKLTRVIKTHFFVKVITESVSKTLQ